MLFRSRWTATSSSSTCGASWPMRSLCTCCWTKWWLHSSPPQALSLPARSAPPTSWSASSLRKARCSLLPSDPSSHSGVGVLFRDPRAPIRIPAVPLPKRANPGSSLSRPLYRGARGEPGEQTQQIAEPERERASTEPAPSARRPACARGPDPRPPAGLSRPFRCSLQDGGRASRRGSPGPCQSTPLLQHRRRERGSGRRGPASGWAPVAG